MRFMMFLFERNKNTNKWENRYENEKILLTMAIAAMGLGACDDPRPAPLTIDNRLTDEEIAAGILTPEVMWK